MSHAARAASSDAWFETRTMPQSWTAMKNGIVCIGPAPSSRERSASALAASPAIAAPTAATTAATPPPSKTTGAAGVPRRAPPTAERAATEEAMDTRLPACAMTVEVLIFTLHTENEKLAAAAPVAVAIAVAVAETESKLAVADNAKAKELAVDDWNGAIW